MPAELNPWISVETRLPEIEDGRHCSDWVLVCRTFSDNWIKAHYCDDKQWRCDGGHTVSQIDYWQEVVVQKPKPVSAVTGGDWMAATQTGRSVAGQLYSIESHSKGHRGSIVARDIESEADAKLISAVKELRDYAACEHLAWSTKPIKALESALVSYGFTSDKSVDNFLTNMRGSALSKAGCIPC